MGGNGKGRNDDYSRFATLGTTTVPSGSRTTKNICRRGPSTVSKKADKPERDWTCPELTIAGKAFEPIIRELAIQGAKYRLE